MNEIPLDANVPFKFAKRILLKKTQLNAVNDIVSSIRSINNIRTDAEGHNYINAKIHTKGTQFVMSKLHDILICTFNRA